jgi:hypothetical protein
MKDFTIQPLIGLNVLQILETMNSSSTSAIISPLSLDQFDPILSSVECCGVAALDGLLFSHDYLDCSCDELDSLLRFGYNAVEMSIRNSGIMSGILDDPEELRFNCLRGPSESI